MSSKWRWLAGLIVAGAIAGGCSSDDEVASNEDRPVVAADNTNVVTAVDDVIVEADRLRFPKATHSEILERVKGDLLVGDRASPASTVNQNPDGFLRTVEAVTVVGDEIIVDTSPAYVTDMIMEGRQSTELKPPKPTAPASHAMAVKATALPTIDFAGLKFGPLEVKSPDIKINLKGVPLTGKFYAKATVDIGKGKLSFKPDTGLVFDIKNGKLEEFQAYLQGQWDAEVSSQFQFETGFSAGVDWKTALGEATAAEKKAFADQLTAFASGGPIPEFNAKVASHSINLPTWWVPTPIGPIPVVSTLNFDLGLSCGVKFKGTVTAKAGTKATATLKIGAKYVNKNGQEGWSPIADKNWDIQPDQVSVTGALDAEASCKLKPTFSLIFYGVAGPYIYVSASATAKASAAQSCDGTSEIPKVDVNLNLSQNYAMGVGAKLGLFIPPLKIDYTLAEADVKLFNLDWVIGDFDVYSGYPDLGFGFCSATGTGGSGGSGGGTGGSGGTSGGGGSGGVGGSGGSGGTGGGTSSPCAGKSSGWYCGASSQFSYGNANTRYLCSGGALASSEVCANGCQVNPPGSDDVCITASPCAGKASGWYCGGSSQFSYGDPSTRYLCSGGALASSEFCPAGCQVALPGYDDTCL